MKEKLNSPTVTHIWVYYIGSVCHKTPIVVMTNEHLLNVHKFLISSRIRRKSLRRYLVEFRQNEMSELEFQECLKIMDERVDWYNTWIARFEIEIKKRKLKPLQPDVNFLHGRGKSYDIRQILRADEKFIKLNGLNTI